MAIAIATVTARGQESEPTLMVTIYPAECRVEVINRKCAKGQARPLVPSTYTLYLETQRVKWASRYSRDTWIGHCEITDADNWLCFYDDKSGAVGIEKGVYWSVSFVKETATGVDGAQRSEVFSTFNEAWRGTHTFYVSQEEHERLEMEFGPRARTID